MHVQLPEAQRDNAIVHLAENYATRIVSAAVEYSKVVYQHSCLSLREFEGARARTAEINGCAVCQNFRANRDLPGYFEAFGGDAASSVASHGPAPDEAFYREVSNWRDSPLYSERERAAIEYAERLGLAPHGVPGDDAFWKRMKSLFSDEEIVDLSYSIACWMGLGRVAHALGMDQACGFVPASRAH